MRRCSLLAMAVLFLASCDHDEPNRPNLPPPPPFQAASPTEAADLFVYAMEGKHTDRYDSLLARDFVFYFNPLDAGNDSLDIPPSWGLEDEMQAVSNMFAASDVEDIILDWRPDPAVSSDATGADSLVRIRNITLEVTQRLPSGEPLFLQVAGDAWFHMRRESWTRPEGDPVWKIVRWDDKTQIFSISSTATEQTTWGQIKDLFHDRGP